MTADERLRDVLRVCDQALSLDEADRKAYLAKACAGDAELRAEVDSLLAYRGDGERASLLDSPPWPPPVRAFEVGERLGPYEVTGPPQVGGMGTVYRALDTRLGRQVALKVLEGTGLWTAPRDRFKREARAIASLDHPNICALYDVGSTAVQASDGPLVDYLVMEYLEGQTLAEVLLPPPGAECGRPVPVGQAIAYAAQIVDALVAAHTAGIIHRDLKPSNIILVAGGPGRGTSPTAKILDFGLAKHLAIGAGHPAAMSTLADVTLPGTILGTFGYQSPEQARGEEVDARSDLFAFGAVFHEMLTGRPAFRRATPAETIAAVLHESPPPPSTINRAVPPSCDAIVEKSLEKDRELRYQTAAEVRADLARLQRGQATTRTPHGPRRADDVPRSTLAGWTAAVAAVVVVAAAVAAAWFGGAWYRDRLPEMVSRVVASAGPDSEPAISPDGRTIAYVAGDEGKQSDIYMVDVAGGRPTRWTDNPGFDRHPAWSPDGNMLYFESSREGRNGIYKAPRSSSASAELVVPNGRAPAIRPDNGAELAFALPEPQGGQVRIAVAPVGAPGKVRVLTRDSEGQWVHGDPAWSPDGREICYDSWDGLWIIPAAGEARASRLTSGVATDFHPAWSSDGRFVYFTSRRGGGPSQLWRIPRAGGRMQPVTQGSGGERAPTVNRDGRFLAFSTGAEAFQVRILDLRTKLVISLPPEGSEEFPALSRDGSTLFYSRSAWNERVICSRKLGPGSPSEPIVLASPRGVATQPSVSPDGRWIAYVLITERNARQIWTVSSSGGVLTPFSTGSHSDLQPSWSRDGTRLVFISDRGEGPRAFAQPVANGRPAGPAVRLTTGGREEWAPVWSPTSDDVALLVAGDTGGEIGIVRADRREAPRIVTSGADAWRVAWRGDGSLLVTANWGTDDLTLSAYDPARRSRDPRFVPIPLGKATSSGSNASCFSVSADGRYLAYLGATATEPGHVGLLEALRRRF